VAEFSWWIDAYPIDRHAEVLHREVSEESMEAIRSILAGESVKDWQERQEAGKQDQTAT